MKINIRKTEVTLRSQSPKEMENLINFYVEGGRVERIVNVGKMIPTARPHKVYSRRCKICGVKCKGARGIAQHTRQHHSSGHVKRPHPIAAVAFPTITRPEQDAVTS